MGYYAGDYWRLRGTLRYARGDPGLFSFLKKAGRAIGGVAKTVLPMVAPLIPGVGGIIGRVSSLLSSPVGRAASSVYQAVAGARGGGGYETGGTPGAVAAAQGGGRLVPARRMRYYGRSRRRRR